MPITRQAIISEAIELDQHCRDMQEEDERLIPLVRKKLTELEQVEGRYKKAKEQLKVFIRIKELRIEEIRNIRITLLGIYREKLLHKCKQHLVNKLVAQFHEKKERVHELMTNPKSAAGHNYGINQTIVVPVEPESSSDFLTRQSWMSLIKK